MRKNQFDDNEMDAAIVATNERREREYAEEELEYKERSSEASVDYDGSSFSDEFVGFGDGWSEFDEFGAMNSRVADRRFGF